MGAINLEPNLHDMFAEFERRLAVLERGTRFTAPNVATDPTTPRAGDIWLNTTSNVLKAVDKNGVVKTITWS